MRFQDRSKFTNVSLYTLFVPNEPRRKESGAAMVFDWMETDIYQVLSERFFYFIGSQSLLNSP